MINHDLFSPLIIFKTCSLDLFIFLDIIQIQVPCFKIFRFKPTPQRQGLLPLKRNGRVSRASATHTLSRLLSLTQAGGALLVSTLSSPPKKGKDIATRRLQKKKKVSKPWTHLHSFFFFFFLPYNRLLRTCINWKKKKRKKHFYPLQIAVFPVFHSEI